MDSLATQPALCKAFRALFHNVEGVALCNAQRQVYFSDDATGVWQELSNADTSALHLCGRLDLIEAARIADGPLFQEAELLARRAS